MHYLVSEKNFEHREARDKDRSLYFPAAVIDRPIFSFLQLQGLLSVLACCLAAALSFPMAFPEDPYHQPIHQPVHGYGKPEVGRVKIQVSWRCLFETYRTVQQNYQTKSCTVCTRFGKEY